MVDGRHKATRLPENWQASIDEFLEHLYLLGRYSQHTLDGYQRDLQKLAQRLMAREVASWQAASAASLAEAVFDAADAQSSQARSRSALRALYGFLQTERGLAENPCADIPTPKPMRSLPQPISEAQVSAMLALPDTETILGLRDKALLELLYGSGLRVSEAVGLGLNQVDKTLGALMVIGKGDKQRLVPMGMEALHWLDRYEHEARGELLKGRLCDEVFVSQKRGGMSRQLAWMIVRRYAEAAGMMNVSPHSLRHAFATHLVNHDADLRIVQEMLGHASLNTTQIYTHVANQRLKQAVLSHHPRSRLMPF